MIVRQSVEVRSNLREVNDQIIADARTAVAEAAHVGADVARTLASTRVRTGRMSAIRTVDLHRTYEGHEAGFESPVFYATFQEWGTLGNRTKPLKRSPRTNRTREPGTGVEPLGFMGAGRRAGRKHLLARIKATLPR